MQPSIKCDALKETNIKWDILWEITTKRDIVKTKTQNTILRLQESTLYYSMYKCTNVQQEINCQTRDITHVRVHTPLTLAQLIGWSLKMSANPSTLLIPVFWGLYRYSCTCRPLSVKLRIIYLKSLRKCHLALGPAYSFGEDGLLLATAGPKAKPLLLQCSTKPSYSLKVHKHNALV